MSDNKITLSTAQMRRIARYEMTFKDIIDDASFGEGDIVCPDVYSITLEDLYHAIKALKGSACYSLGADGISFRLIRPLIPYFQFLSV